MVSWMGNISPVGVARQGRYDSRKDSALGGQSFSHRRVSRIASRRASPSVKSRDLGHSDWVHPLRGTADCFSSRILAAYLCHPRADSAGIGGVHCSPLSWFGRRGASARYRDMATGDLCKLRRGRRSHTGSACLWCFRDGCWVLDIALCCSP